MAVKHVNLRGDLRRARGTCLETGRILRTRRVFIDNSFGKTQRKRGKDSASRFRLIFIGPSRKFPGRVIDYPVCASVNKSARSTRWDNPRISWRISSAFGIDVSSSVYTIVFFRGHIVQFGSLSEQGNFELL